MEWLVGSPGPVAPSPPSLILPVPPSTVKACLDLLVPWLHQYIDSLDANSATFCDVTLHGPFYAACQAVFYTLVFRHQAILEGSMRKGEQAGLWGMPGGSP